MNKIRIIWDSLPIEIRVGIYIAVSGALAALADYLKVVEADKLVLLIIAGVINIFIVFLKTRAPQVKKKLSL